MDKQQSFRLERLQSFRQKSLRMGTMEKQKSFRNVLMEKQQSFKERKSKESPGKRGDTVLHMAARAGNLTSVVKIISDCDENQLKDLISRQNQGGETVLYVASERGFVGIVREILKVSDLQSASIKANNSFDSFHIAAKQGHFGSSSHNFAFLSLEELVKELWQSFPAIAMTTNLSNSTALDTAATLGHIDIVNFLLETGVDLAKIARNNGKTVLHSAARMGHVDVIKSIQSKDPGISFRTDKKGQTAFHMAVKGNNVDIVRELLKPNPSIINVEDSKGNTALHIATRKGRPEIVRALLSVSGIDINAVNRAGETPLGIADKFSIEEISTILRELGAMATARDPPNPTKQLKQTVSDIRHDVQSQIKHIRQTEIRVQNIKKRLRKLHIGGLNNAINSNTVVAVLIATVAFAAIFTLPGQYVETQTTGFTLGQAYISYNAAFIIFLVFDSLALFISLAVVVVQTSLIVVEQKAKKLMVFVMNKLMWFACIFISVSFISLTYIVVGKHDLWLAWCTMAIGVVIMLATIGSMCFCIVVHRIDEKNLRNVKRMSRSGSRSLPLAVASDPEMLNSEYKKMYAL